MEKITLTKRQMLDVVAAWYNTDPEDMLDDFLLDDTFDWDQEQEIVFSKPPEPKNPLDMSVKSAWSGKEYKIRLKVEHYYDGNLALRLLSMDEDGFWEPYAMLTVNLNGKRDENEAFVDINNFEQAESFIREWGIGRPTIVTRTSGFCVYPMYRFDMDRINEIIRIQEEEYDHAKV